MMQPVGTPLVSVIIPSYNHAAYLPEAIESVLKQFYTFFEIIVVDDGSTDDTSTLVKKYTDVTYIYQENQGLSAARNTGIEASHGDFLVFLDADDILYEDALAHNLSCLQQHPEAAFVSGAYDVISSDGNFLKEVVWDIRAEHYLFLLERNYIAMHATVMYRRSVFSTFRYDTSLRSCEDYDMYLKIARNHPVLHTTKKLAAYRMHATNMSANYEVMLKHSLLVLSRQWPLLRSQKEREAYKRGVRFWKEYYCNLLYVHLRTGEVSPTKAHLQLLKKHKPAHYFRYQLLRFV
ncbi:MAG TPA: glycosyltransferase [Flavisolibacter sp.]|nr:glycosyltransferase [Flavisolibacter sp.]